MQVSLITCTFSSEKTIKNCCLSISTQSLKNLEHIIVDKDSIDNTLRIVKKFKIENQKIHQQKSDGIYGALNEGLKITNGEIIGLLHSDDEFINHDFLDKMVSIFSDEKIDIFFSKRNFDR